ncbi:hypothetical protein KSP39_PZI001364 [Platanthera zijinensis]|uniref:VQ domain-containing protein n=1 Tax=Platanthera zijinensis TaxID=2320716 RepID=A0AAP0GF78_9ASPA
MAEHCSAIESWAEPTAYLKSQSWISPAFARENEALTKALQISLSDDSSASETLSYAVAPPADAVLAGDRRSFPNRGSISGKITKRKSRASKRTPTTYINADPENFRRMVQEVTGIRFGESRMQGDPLVWHEHEWSAVGRPPSCPPTLDTSSALLLEHGGPAAASCALAGSAADGLLFDFESFPSFPTLESWGAM